MAQKLSGFSAIFLNCILKSSVSKKTKYQTIYLKFPGLFLRNSVMLAKLCYYF